MKRETPPDVLMIGLVHVSSHLLRGDRRFVTLLDLLAGRSAAPSRSGSARSHGHARYSIAQEANLS